jgi:hypothetical protein
MTNAVFGKPHGEVVLQTVRGHGMQRVGLCLPYVRCGGHWLWMR